MLTEKGFTIIDSVYAEFEIKKILSIIEKAETSNETFRKSNEIFAIRQFLKELPECIDHIFNKNLNSIIEEQIGENYFVIKSIYFDKPETSNWYVPYHQDLTISVNKKLILDGFEKWTNKYNQYAVQPPIDFLKNITTIRIHLDQTDENNGALKVIPGSHLRGIIRPEEIDWQKDQEYSCNVNQGGIMIMKPLLLHCSKRTLNNQKRRVIHIEFSNNELSGQLEWAERYNFNSKSFQT